MTQELDFNQAELLHGAALGDPYADEARTVRALAAQWSDADHLEPKRRALNHAAQLVEAVRASGKAPFAIETLLREYPISSNEGLALMRLAEALLRVPDAATASALIADRLEEGDWLAHAMGGHGLLAATSGFALWAAEKLSGTSEAGHGLFGRLGEATVRAATLRAMGLMGEQFVLGHTIERALKRSAETDQAGYRHSYDMLGEGARGDADALRYYAAYEQAIHAIGASMNGRGPHEGPGISIKLSALHARFEEAQRERVWAELLPRVTALAQLAASYDMGLTIDAEESERLELSIDLFCRLLAAPLPVGWDGLGLAVQAYGKRAGAVIARVTDEARLYGRRIMLRLVKGAYWDSEIKAAQERGLPGYPVYTRKAYTDLSYLVCARQLLSARDVVYPQFATHNALSIASILEMTGGVAEGYEFQRLHGMGDALYRALREQPQYTALPCRVYAPVGEHRDLLAYLVRRLIENGANSSFVNQLADPLVPLDELLAHPLEAVAAHRAEPDPALPLPLDILGLRQNSAGLDLQHPAVLGQVRERLREAPEVIHAGPLVPGAQSGFSAIQVRNPARFSQVIGTCVPADEGVVEQAFANARTAYRDWSATPAELRAVRLERAADLLEAHALELMRLCAYEAGKTAPDALAEVREAVDFCRYYAAEARRLFENPITLPGVTGESNQLSLHGRGVFVCISPWNFPLAIFLGQVTAALAAGNTVLAKPAPQTPLIAWRATQLLHEAGIPSEVLQLLPGGTEVGGWLTSHAATAGVAFTGSTATGRAINRALAAREVAIAPLIAETGGLNAMIVDSTALPEQVVDAVVQSAFRSAGQRCSALRVLYVQEEIADGLIRMLMGATAQLRVGDPADTATDVGPVIDAQALGRLTDHTARLHGQLLFEAPLPAGLPPGHYIAPCAFSIGSMSELPGEVFGPILHIVRYRADQLDAVVDEINASGYGLTFGIQTRIDSRAQALHARVAAGNCYVNRNTIGAVVGCQPFGGEGLSGTGPKAGGPNYLARFALERVLTVNTAAAGGNVALMAAPRRR